MVTQSNLGLGTNIVNISGEELSEAEKDVLSKGLKFIPTPKNIDKENTVKSVVDFRCKIKLQYFFRNQPRDSTREKLQFIEKSQWVPTDKMIPSEILENLDTLTKEIEDMPTIKDKPNLTNNQIGALRKLKNKTHLIIKKADKGSSTVIMRKVDYIHEAERELNHPKFDTKINKPIFPETSKKIAKIIKEITKSNYSSLDEMSVQVSSSEDNIYIYK